MDIGIMERKNGNYHIIVGYMFGLCRDHVEIHYQHDGESNG